MKLLSLFSQWGLSLLILTSFATELFSAEGEGLAEPLGLGVPNPAIPQDASSPEARIITPTVREWTNPQGKSFTAEFLGVRGQDVFLNRSGSVVHYPLSMFSQKDNEFVQMNPVSYYNPWRAWPADAGEAIQAVKVIEQKASSGGSNRYIYTTPHFRFHTDAELGTPLTQNLARVFELTYQLHSKSPFGILATPENGLFDAKLFAATDAYIREGGPARSAGVYLPRKKVILAPLDQMGVVKGPGNSGLRKDKNYDPSTIIHELTHMLTHDILADMPTWFNEGYAGYIEKIPLEGNSFRVTRVKIKQGMSAVFEPSNPVFIKGSDYVRYRRGSPKELFKIERILTMSDHEWSTGRPPRSPEQIEPNLVGRAPFRLDRIPRLATTAHLIFYYFIEIEGEMGVQKLRAYLDANRRETQEFLKIPGVSRNSEGGFNHPPNLKLHPTAQAPYTDPQMLNLRGIDALLQGESASVVGARIEDALRRDLGSWLSFNEDPSRFIVQPLKVRE